MKTNAVQYPQGDLILGHSKVLKNTAPRGQKVQKQNVSWYETDGLYC